MPIAGSLSTAIDALRTLISNVVYFQTWTGAANAAAALQQIFTGELGTPILSVAVSGGVLTITTREVHPFAAAQKIEIDGASLGVESPFSIDGPQTIVATPTTKSFTLATALANQGPFYPDGCIVLPAARPFICISEEEDALNYSMLADATPSVNGMLDILIEGKISSANNQNAYNALYEMKDGFGQFCDGLIALSGTGDYMYLKALTVVVPPKFIDRAEHADNTVRFERWQALIRVAWGLE